MLSIKFLCDTLPYMSISAGVIRAIALQEVNHTPNAKACAERDHEGLQNTDCAIEKCHIRTSIKSC